MLVKNAYPGFEMLVKNAYPGFKPLTSDGSSNNTILIYIRIM